MTPSSAAAAEGGARRGQPPRLRFLLGDARSGAPRQPPRPVPTSARSRRGRTCAGHGLMPSQELLLVQLAAAVEAVVVEVARGRNRLIGSKEPPRLSPRKHRKLRLLRPVMRALPTLAGQERAKTKAARRTGARGTTPRGLRAADRPLAAEATAGRPPNRRRTAREPEPEREPELGGQQEDARRRHGPRNRRAGSGLPLRRRRPRLGLLTAVRVTTWPMLEAVVPTGRALRVSLRASPGCL